ncbi:MAG: aspartate ammonia-lyase [Cyanobacteria bacterium PR.3.49]|nr:aspartate ammonia-lyase [Cyanobacteria bacterium PR.3.49]
MVTKRADVRVEKDELGEVFLPAKAYYGAQTYRLKDILPTSGLKTHPRLIDALLLVKKACAAANLDSKRIEPQVARAIMQAADEAYGGQWRDQFVVEILSSGAGTALNININEVLANRGQEILGGALGSYDIIHPVHHVDLAQSPNDVFPTAMRIAVLLAAKEFEPVLLDLERLLRRKSLEFERVIKMGRSHLQDALPITLGQEFNAFGSSIERCLKRLKEAGVGLTELNIGATHVGTGLGADSNYIHAAVERLSQYTGIRLRQSDDFFRISQSMSDFVEFSSALKELAVELTKIANDLRLLSSGPKTGFSEITAPELIVERSLIRPNTLPNRRVPTLVECINMASSQVFGNDIVVALAAQSGQFESNVMTPLIIHNILQSLDLLRSTIEPFNSKYLRAITANHAACNLQMEEAGVVLAVVSKRLGEKRAQDLAREAAQADLTLKDLVIQRALIAKEELDRMLSYKELTSMNAAFSSPDDGDTTGGAGNQ